jgi:predicted nucleic acid-binding protein
MNYMNAADTNVWVYFHDKRDPRKQAAAQTLVASLTRLILPWQVGCEFLAASRKLEPFGFTNDLAWQALEAMQRTAARVALPDPVDWVVARDMQRSDMLSFWDALLLATCVRHGVTTLYTEDFGSPRTIRGVKIVNPFATPAAPAP